MKTASPERISEAVKLAYILRLTKGQLVDAVRAYAAKHYDQGGWDEVVECWEDEDILREIGQCYTAKAAIKRVGAMVKIRYQYAQEIRSTAF